MSRTLILLGLILVAVGLLWRWIGPLKIPDVPPVITTVLPFIEILTHVYA
jgi:hypothetical protein